MQRRQLMTLLLLLLATGCRSTHQPRDVHCACCPSLESRWKHGTIILLDESPSEATRIAASAQSAHREDDLGHDSSPVRTASVSDALHAGDSVQTVSQSSELPPVDASVDAEQREDAEPLFDLQPVEAQSDALPTKEVELIDAVSSDTGTAAGGSFGGIPPEARFPDAVVVNLPTALSMIGGQHPAVGLAQWRVQEAYARLDSARVLWLPTIRPGLSFHRHDGNYQASDGSIIDINRNSGQFGLGVGATGAGTTPLPGIAAAFHVADAVFEPRVARTTAWARGHAANATFNRQLLDAATAYLELLRATQQLHVVQESNENTSILVRLTADFAAAGQGLQADADRMQTESLLARNRLVQANENVDVASVRLAQVLSLDGYRPIVVMDPTVVPLDILSPESSRQSLISTGLLNRPELKEAHALVAVACERYQRQRYAPLVPSVLLGFSGGGFGGGLGNRLRNVDDRYDFDALMSWEVRNLGLGEKAARRERQTQIQQARFEQIRRMDQVALDVSEAHAQVSRRKERIAFTQDAIGSARDSLRRNLSRIRDGQGLPIEALQSVRALEDAQAAYVEAVVEYNIAQFRLQWALGWPVAASPE